MAEHEAEADRLAALLRQAPDPGGWRAGMDTDDYREMADWLVRQGVVTSAVEGSDQ